MNVLGLSFNYIVFPGVLFSFFMGGLGWWLERKLTARFQYRVGPPWYQTFLDVAKLFIKETLIPKGASRILFILSPLITVSTTIFFTVIIGQTYFFHKSVIADAIVLLYLLIIPSLFIILGAFSSRNSLALTGAARETKLMLAYEFVFIVCLLIVIIKSKGSILLSDIMQHQAYSGMHIQSASGIIAAILAVFYIQAKLGIVPFDMAEADQEIMAGTMIEYSGPLLGFYRVSKVFLYFSLPLFVIVLLAYVQCATLIESFLFLVLEYLVIAFIAAVIKNINPRARIKDALSFFWFFLFPLGIVGVLLALKGL